MKHELCPKLQCVSEERLEDNAFYSAPGIMTPFSVWVFKFYHEDYGRSAEIYVHPYEKLQKETDRRASTTPCVSLFPCYSSCEWSAGGKKAGTA